MRILSRIFKKKDGPASGGYVSVNADHQTNWVQKIVPNARRDQQIALLQKGYVEMTELMQSIRTHLERQGEMHDVLVDTLKKASPALDGIAQQADVLKELVGHSREAEKLIHQQIKRSERNFAIFATLLILIITTGICCGLYLIRPQSEIQPLPRMVPPQFESIQIEPLDAPLTAQELETFSASMNPQKGDGNE